MIPVAGCGLINGGKDNIAIFPACSLFVNMQEK